MLERNSFVILSACKGDSETVDWENTLSLKRALEHMGFSFTQAQGKYKDTTEISLIVPVETKECVDILLKMSMQYEQECILLVYGMSKESYLVGSGYQQSIGYWTKMEGGNVWLDKAYTYCNEIYYQCI